MTPAAKLSLIYCIYYYF